MRKMRAFARCNFAIIAMLFSAMLVSCSADEVVATDEDETTTDEESAAAEATAWIDEQLEKYYLYNEEYKTMERDLTLEYDDFLETTLMNMSTNVLDKKFYETLYGVRFYDYLLYSYVIREESTKSRAIMSSREDVSFGFASTELVTLNGEYAIAVHGVYEDSPAAECGFKRGTVITNIEGESITWINYYYGLAYNLLYPSDGDQYTITAYNMDEPQSITAKSTEINPILHQEILEPNIGYLVYSQFDNNFDDDLEASMEEFIAAGVTDMILDLRINPGGYISSATLLGSMLSGTYGSGLVFAYYLLNDDLTNSPTSTAAMMGMSYDSNNRAFYINFDDSTPKLTSLTTPRIYCLVSGNTASASELLINSLRGINFEVILIGSTTDGKNVGMVDLSGTFGGYNYDLLPITFENRNAKMEGGYEAGMEVDYEVNDLYGFTDYGASEPMVAKTLELITGESATMDETRSAASYPLQSVAGKADNRGVGGARIPIGE